MDNKYLYVGLIFVVLVIFFIFGRSNSSDGNLNGPIHWHPQIKVYINGEEFPIPNNLGVERLPHSPVHTHDEGDGTIHFEFQQSTIPRNKLTVGYFFNDVWNKKFNSECILDYCNNPDKTVSMSVNGKDNKEFENYVMQDGDLIEVRYQ